MIDNLQVEKKANFLGATADFETAQNIIMGVPLDLTTTYRPGTRFGPNQIRKLSNTIELYSPKLARSLTEISLGDVGDLDLPLGDLEGSLELIEQNVEYLIAKGKRPIILGGEHLLTWPSLKAVSKKYNDLVVIDWDAHADMRRAHNGNRYNHGTVMNIIKDHIGPENMYLLGIRSEAEASMKEARECNLYLEDVLEPMAKISKEIGHRPVYFSLDIDVFDPAFAPGTGAPETGGIDVREGFKALAYLSDLNIVAFDLVEVAPAYDHSEITSLLASKITRELLLTIK